MHPRDPIGPIEELALTGMALSLASQIGELVGLTRQPVSMTTIRRIAREIIETTEANSSFDEHHYLQYSEWFTRLTFPDGSHVTFGEEEN